MYPIENDLITTHVSRVLQIESVTWGNPNTNEKAYLARFQGKLRNQDSAAAYDQLAEALRPMNITPLFREEQNKHYVVLLSGVQKASPSNPWINLILFGLTFFSVLLTGAIYGYDGATTITQYMLNNIGNAVAFAASILGILLAHEFGHYLVARFHHTAATLPYFIPFPFSPFGTMGAVIVQKESHKNRRILLDIGIAGPLAGLVVAIPVLLLGLHLSEVGTFPQVIPSGEGLYLEGNSILYLLAKYAVFGEFLPAPADYGGLSPALYWVRYFFTGLPSPLGGTDVMLHPVAWAGWAGLLVTALNLIPAGQLDGGHIINSMFGKRSMILLPFVLGGLVLMGIAWNGWWLWAGLVFFLGRQQAEPLDQITPLDQRRKALGFLGVVIFVLVFTPVPLRILFGS
jgi:membrane-associated protease RseP (regulator of RpoE activity)